MFLLFYFLSLSAFLFFEAEVFPIIRKFELAQLETSEEVREKEK